MEVIFHLKSMYSVKKWQNIDFHYPARPLNKKKWQKILIGQLKNILNNRREKKTLPIFQSQTTTSLYLFETPDREYFHESKMYSITLLVSEKNNFYELRKKKRLRFSIFESTFFSKKLHSSLSKITHKTSRPRVSESEPFGPNPTKSSISTSKDSKSVCEFVKTG